MKKLKTILQSNLTYIILFISISLFIFIKTIVIKYESILSDENTLTGIVIDLNIGDDKISFTLKSHEKVICNYYLNNDSNISFDNLLGKKIKVNGKLKEVVNNTIPNTFNYKKYLYNNKLYKTFIVNNLEILEDENIFYKFKNNIIKKINNYEDEIKTYLNLFILGDKTYLDNNMYNNYRVNGIWHLFAISGMHISLIILVLDKLLKKIKFNKVIISLVLLYFAFSTNFSASILRAIIFYYLSNLFNFLNIKVDSKKILFLTAFIILLIDPFMIYNVGFQYSFLIAFAIMLCTNKITGNYFMKILKISIISFLVSMPITINMNYEINLLSILLNIIYVPFISFVVFPCNVLTFVFPFLSSILKILIYILELSNNFFNIIKINLIVPKMGFIIIIIYYLFLYLYHRKNNNKYLMFSIVVILFNVIFSKIDNNYSVYYFDVGQGDSSLIISPYKKKTVMIDTGGLINSNYYISNNTILFLKSVGITKINYLILTHGDYDHMGEAINLVNNFKVEKVIFNCGEYNDLEKELIKVLDMNQIPYYSCIKELNIANNKLYFLNNEEYDNENDNSSIIHTKLNSHKFLFMGDAGVKVEEDLIEKYNLKDIDILKVGHHGSKTSSSETFINEINPKYSIISVGKNNRYGHPNKEVLNNLEDSKIYRTDKQGSIMFKIKNNKLKIENCAP